MAEENTLENRVKDAIPNNDNSAKEQAQKLKSTLDSVVGELGDLVNLSVGVAAPAAGYALTGNAGVPVVSAAFVAASEGNITSKKFRDESLAGAIWGTMLNYFTKPLKNMSTLAKTGYLALLPLISNSVYPTVDHLIKNKSPKGIYEKLSKNYWPNVKKTFKTVWPLNLLAGLFLSNAAYIVGTIGVANYLFRKFIVKGKEEENSDKTPYSVAAPVVAGKLVRNTTYGLSEAVNAIGSSLGDLYKSTPKAAAPAPAN